MWAMGPDPLHIAGSRAVEGEEHAVGERLERIGNTIMNRASGGGMLSDDPIGAVLRNQDKKRAAARLIGQAYVTAYALMASNREGIEEIAAILSERKEIHGDEVVDLLNSVNLSRPTIDLYDDRTWPAV
jgi:hypothetical protein